MRKKYRSALLALLCSVSLGMAADANAAFGYYQQGRVEISLNAAETELTVVWFSGVISNHQVRGCPTDSTGSPYFRLRLDGRSIHEESLTGKLRNSGTGFIGIGAGPICKYTYIFRYPNGSRIPVGVYRAEFGVTLYDNVTRIEASKEHSVNACSQTRGKRPIYLSNNGVFTDYFYTLSLSDTQLAGTIGYGYMGVPFAMPYPEPLDTAAFDRYFKGAPQYEHFYSTNSGEAAYLINNGYEPEGSEGHVYTTPKPGAWPLHRYVRYNSANGDLYHYYTIYYNDVQTTGMYYEGVVGHVCPPN
jgi:hypothetical protein